MGVAILVYTVVSLSCHAANTIASRNSRMIILSELP